jgi:hypothetical protein
MDKLISLEDRGLIPCLHNIGEAHPYQGPALRSSVLLALLCRAMGRHAQLGLAVDNLRRILTEEHVLTEELRELPPGLLEDVRLALDLAQSVIPGGHREALSRITRALERLDAYQEMIPPRGQA